MAYPSMSFEIISSCFLQLAVHVLVLRWCTHCRLLSTIQKVTLCSQQCCWYQIQQLHTLWERERAASSGFTHSTATDETHTKTWFDLCSSVDKPHCWKSSVAENVRRILAIHQRRRENTNSHIETMQSDTVQYE